MLGSDSDTDGSDDEEEDEEEEGSVARRIAQSAAGNAHNAEDYRMGKRPKAMRVGEAGRTGLPSSLDDLLDDQPSLRQTMRGEKGSSDKGVGGKRGRGEVDDSSRGKRTNGVEGSAKKDTDDDKYNVVVTADGKVIVKEVEVVEEAPAVKMVRGKRVAEDSAAAVEEEPNKQEHKEAVVQKRRKLNLKEPGEEYRAKKAGGDVWKKGMLEPHAFIPLDPRLLSKKHRTQAIGHFGVVVKGGANKKASALRNKGKATADKGGERHSRNRPHQKKHK